MTEHQRTETTGAAEPSTALRQVEATERLAKAAENLDARLAQLVALVQGIAQGLARSQAAR